MAIISDIQLSKNSYFSDQTTTALTTAFVKQGFGFHSFSIIIANDASATYIEFSFDGTTVHGRIKDTDQTPREMPFRRHEAIWLRGEAGGEAYRLEAY